MNARVGHTLLLAVLLFAVAIAAPVSDEPAATFKASDLIPASKLKGPHYTVAGEVPTPAFFHEFSVVSDYGTFEAVGLSQLHVRTGEVAALAALDEVSKSRVFLESAGGAVVDIGESAVKAVSDPKETAQNLGAGIKRFGVNLGRVARRGYDSATDSDAKGPTEGQDSGAETAANAVLGVSSAMRQWARKVGADPYTTNPALRAALKEIAQVDAAGSIATKVVVPIPAVVTTTASVSDLVWGKDPEEVRKVNEQRAKELGVPANVAGEFFKNGWFTLTMQTRLIAALHAVNVKGCAAYLLAAAGAEHQRQASFFVESAEMLQRFHASTPVTALLTDSLSVVAVRGDTAVALLPLDFLRSTARATETLGEWTRRAAKELGTRRFEVHLTGRATKRSMADMERLGLHLTQGVPAPWSEPVR